MSDVDTDQNLSNPQVPVAPPQGGEAPATTQATTTAADTAVPGETEGQAQAEPKRDRKVEKRISRLTQKVDAASKEAAYWRGVAEARAAGTEPPATDPQPQQQTRQAPAADPAEVEHSKSVLERIREAGEDSDDFDDVMEVLTSDDFKVSRTMRDYIGESDKPFDIAKALTDHPKEAARIARLTDALAVRALDKLAAGVTAKAGPRTTNTPPPPPTVGGRGTPTFDPNKASMEEYEADWKRRQAARSR